MTTCPAAAGLRDSRSCMVAAAAASTAGDSPEETLKARGLKRVGSTYVLPAESDVQKKSGELKALRTQLVLAARRQADAEMEVQDQKGMVREMLAQSGRAQRADH